MAFKINIAEPSTGKTWKIESESEAFLEKAVKDKIAGKEVSPEFEGYEFEITGASDKAGFPSFAEVEGVGLKKVLLGYGKGMHRKPRGVKKINRNPRPKGLRLRKTVRGKIISSEVIQVNLLPVKHGKRALAEIFPEQNQAKEKKVEAVAQ